MPDTPERPDATEQQVRRALGLTGRNSSAVIQQRPDQARARHRFAQDGSVPVVMLNQRSDELAGLRDRIAELTGMLEHERAAHAATRRTIAEMQAAHQALKTRMAHAELAHREELAQERQARTLAQEALAAANLSPRRGPGRPPRGLLSTASADPAPDPDPEPEAPAPVAVAEPVAAPVAAAPSAPAPISADPPDMPRRKPGRPRTAVAKEPKPVRWWTPGYRSKAKS